jgi:hypothetical protein
VLHLRLLRGVAQSGSARALGARRRGFKSRLPDPYFTRRIWPFPCGSGSNSRLPDASFCGETAAVSTISPSASHAMGRAGRKRRAARRRSCPQRAGPGRDRRARPTCIRLRQPYPFRERSAPSLADTCRLRRGLPPPKFEIRSKRRFSKSLASAHWTRRRFTSTRGDGQSCLRGPSALPPPEWRSAGVVWFWDNQQRRSAALDSNVALRAKFTVGSDSDRHRLLGYAHDAPP